jgi:hypothetical protein
MNLSLSICFSASFLSSFHFFLFCVLCVWVCYYYRVVVVIGTVLRWSLIVGYVGKVLLLLVEMWCCWLIFWCYVGSGYSSVVLIFCDWEILGFVRSDCCSGCWWIFFSPHSEFLSLLNNPKIRVWCYLWYARTLFSMEQDWILSNWGRGQWRVWSVTPWFSKIKLIFDFFGKKKQT